MVSAMSCMIRACATELELSCRDGETTLSGTCTFDGNLTRTLCGLCIILYYHCDALCLTSLRAAEESMHVLPIYIGEYWQVGRLPIVFWDCRLKRTGTPKLLSRRFLNDRDIKLLRYATGGARQLNSFKPSYKLLHPPCNL